MQDVRNLKVWQRAHALALDVYPSTDAFPPREIYGLTSRLRPAARSIGANLAEGCGRGGGPGLRRFLRIAMGPASELEYHLLLARDLSFLPDDAYERLSSSVVEVKRMLAALIVKLKAES